MGGIEHTFEQHDDVLVVAFAGEYGIGSAGNPDADAMRAVVLRGRRRFRPAAIVLDLRELDYQ